ncbi:8480_t:CDS:1, partial [Entrophospora sp. SA101]
SSIVIIKSGKRVGLQMNLFDCLSSIEFKRLSSIQSFITEQQIVKVQDESLSEFERDQVILTHRGTFP